MPHLLLRGGTRSEAAIDWYELMKLARDVNPDVLPHPSARQMLLVITTYADTYGETFVGIAALCRGMGYALSPEGRLTRSARVSFWRTFRKLAEHGVAERTPCTCKTLRHPFHVQLNILALSGNPTVAAEAIRLLQERQPNGCRRRTRTAAGSGNRLATSNPSTTTPVLQPHLNTMGTRQHPRKASVDDSPRMRSESHGSTRPIDAEAIPEAAADDKGETDG